MPKVFNMEGKLINEYYTGNTLPPPQSWHSCFIAEQRERGVVQPHLLAMLEVLLQEAEKAYGGELPEPGSTEGAAEGRAALLIWARGDRRIELCVFSYGETTLFSEWDSDGHQIESGSAFATALRELFQREGEGE